MGLSLYLVVLKCRSRELLYMFTIAMLGIVHHSGHFGGYRHTASANRKKLYWFRQNVNNFIFGHMQNFFFFLTVR